MRYSHELRYDAAPDRVHEMLTDPAFREKVARAQHMAEVRVSVEPAAAGTSVVVDTKRPAEGLPGFARRIVGHSIHIVRTERWSDARTAGFEVAIPGKPASLTGAITVTEEGTGALETVSGDLKVSIPMLGGQLERLVAQMLDEGFAREQQVGGAWLAGDR